MTSFLPTPVQSPRIPVWVAGTWPSKAPMRRAARWDGVCILKRTLAPPDQLRAAVAYIEEYRGGMQSFDVTWTGFLLEMTRELEPARFLRTSRAASPSGSKASARSEARSRRCGAESAGPAEGVGDAVVRPACHPWRAASNSLGDTVATPMRRTTSPAAALASRAAATSSILRPARGQHRDHGVADAGDVPDVRPVGRMQVGVAAALADHRHAVAAARDHGVAGGKFTQKPWRRAGSRLRAVGARQGQLRRLAGST